MSLFDHSGYKPTTWILIFFDPYKHRWWNRLFEPGFHHVYAVQFVGAQCIRYDPHLAFTEIELIDPAEIRLPWDATLMEVIAWRKLGQVRTPFYIGPPTCVESVKALLGIRSFMTWTPWQLYKLLAKGRHNGRFQQFQGVRLGPLG